MRASHNLAPRALGILLGLAAAGLATACAAPPADVKPAPSSDVVFTDLVEEFLADLHGRQPTQATYLGIHDHDHKLEDYSRAGVDSAVAAIRAFRKRAAAIDARSLTTANQLDHEQLIRAMDSMLLTLEVIRPWATQPDSYSSGLTRTAYVMIKRNFASPEERLRKLIARERVMPGALAEAKKNLDNPPRIATEIALQQIDDNRAFFETAVAEAFPEVSDQALLAEFRQANGAVVAALQDYKAWMTNDLLPRANGNFAIGADTYRKKLSADEMIDLPLDELLAIAERDLRRNQEALAETVRQIDPKRPLAQVLARVQQEAPPPSSLIATTQSELDAIARFMVENKIVTIPDAEPALVQETPPFLRATSTASMDIPGPYERVATEAYYNMTLPDSKLSAAQTREFMTQWYYPAITNVSVHEVWPGHYLQFLYARHFPSDVRKVFGASSNSEGWAHYCEQMVIDSGFHADDPRYRLAQIQDALLRDVRFIAGIRLHTRGMTVAEAEGLFVKEGYQPRPVAVSESKRGTSDPTYGYYTMGKLMILKLRDDYRALKEKRGTSFSLREFHDTFVKLGPLPLPLIRKAMMGEGDTGPLF
ncbi:MAG: DUF885 domain-containing protein [Acidimicrobiia bacterium]|nr:DUF885 domain-containing protein [Acidimicrobiia bacterium]